MTPPATIGTVVDVRLAIDGDLDDHPDTPSLFGLLVSPRTRSSYLGYERSDARRPTSCRHSCAGATAARS